MSDRVLRAGILKSDDVNKLSWAAEVFYRRLMSVADDFGKYEARANILRADLYPLKIDKVTIADVGKWLAECATAGLVSCYTVEGKEYLQILKFNQRLRIQRSRFPDPLTIDSECQQPADKCQPVFETETVFETEKKSLLAVAPPEGRVPTVVFNKKIEEQPSEKKEYAALASQFQTLGRQGSWPTVKAFVKERKPGFAAPYVDLWNLFVTGPSFKLPEVKTMNESRLKKLMKRIREDAFDFVGILEKIKRSDHLKGINSKWSVSFDWIIENDTNYLKILEGNYD